MGGAREGLTHAQRARMYKEYASAIHATPHPQADPVIERLDPRRFFRHRLYRDATTFTGNYHVKVKREAGYGLWEIA